MTPDETLSAQIAAYRGMTGQERLEIALRLHELSYDVARCGNRSQFPGADDVEVERRLELVRAL